MSERVSEGASVGVSGVLSAFIFRAFCHFFYWAVALYNLRFFFLVLLHLIVQ